MAIADDHTLLRHSNSLEASASGRASQTSRFEDAPPHVYAHKFVTSSQGGASTEAYPPPTGTHVDASVSTYDFAYPTPLAQPPHLAQLPSTLAPWLWLPQPSISQRVASPTATNHLTPASAQTGMDFIELVLSTLGAASMCIAAGMPSTFPTPSHLMSRPLLHTPYPLTR